MTGVAGMAGHRPTDWYVLDLEKDPTPGDPDRVKRLAKTLHDFADDVSDALRLVKGMAGEDTLLEWAGKSAEVFKEEFGGVPKNLKKLKKSYELCGDALADFWPKLERAQALADRALVKGREAQSDLSSANSRLSSADSWVTRANKEADKYKDDPIGSKSGGDKPDEGKVRAATRDAQHAKSAQTTARSDVDSAQDALDAAKKMAADARRMREDAARDAKSKIDEASDAGIQNRSWWEEVGDWFTDNWDTIVSVCKIVVAVVGIVAMIIGGPILGVIVLVAALVVLADTLYKYSKGQASLWDVGLAALDCIPGMKGITTLGGLAKGLKGGMAAMKGMRGGLKGMSLALRGLGKNARGMIADGAKGAYNRTKETVKSLFTDPVDLATGTMFLPQTDIVLPGVLPLVFTRRVASDYRCGWWFGPTWASTIDQRLEVDEQGVVFVTEDGLLLSYSHPVHPGLPVLPDRGPHQPLLRLDDGGYRIDDLATGHSRLFRAPDPSGMCLLARVTDRNGNTAEFDYDDQGTPLGIRHSGGYRLGFTAEDDRIVALTLKGAAEDGGDELIKRYGYSDGNLMEVFHASDEPLRFEYDDRLRITSWTDTNSSTYSYIYDEKDRCTAEGGEAGHIAVTLQYDGEDPQWPGMRITALTTADGAVNRFVINDSCQVVAEVDALGAITRTEYDVNHHVVAYTDALQHTTRFVNDEVGRPQAITRPDGATTRITYNSFGRPTLIVLPGGARWVRDYDERGNCTSIVNPMGRAMRFAYDDRGGIVATVDPLGETTHVLCNSAGLTIELTDPLNSRSTYEYDAFGRLTAVADGSGAVTRMRWSTQGHLIHCAYPDGSAESWSYDGEGNCVRHVNAAGLATVSEYTHFDLLSARTDPDGSRYEFDYDSALRLTKVINPQKLEWSYAYDLAGRLVSEVDFDSRSLEYGYDPANRLTSRTNALGRTIRFDRDSLGQVVRKTAGEVETTFSYDLDGRMTEAVGPDGRLAREYDAVGLLALETVNGRAVSHTYDLAGRRTRRATPTGVVSEWTHDAAGNTRTLSAAGQVIHFNYDATGNEVLRSVGTNPVLTQAWDGLGRLREQGVLGAGGQTIQRRSYVYRADGHLLDVDDQLNGAQHFSLDPMGRVNAVQAMGWTERYAYDEAGNLTDVSGTESASGHLLSGTRSYRGTRIVRAGGVHYEYDAAGRLVLRRKARLSHKADVWRYSWSDEDRLTGVVTPDGTHWRYHYDPLGRRIAKLRLAADGVSVAERTDFCWDGTTLCEQTTHQTGTANEITLTWGHQGLHPVSQTERVTAVGERQEEIDTRFFAIVTDLIGAPRELLDGGGNIVWRSRPMLWGSTAWNSGATAYTPLRFPGQYFDPESGLHYNYLRYYDPDVARYVSSDPMGLSPAPNPVGYVDNPYSWSDPLGLGPYDRAVKRTNKVMKNAEAGTVRRAPNYHGRLPDELERDILASPDGVYASTGTGGRFIFHKGQDIVITEGQGANAGQVVTSYGPSGPRGKSGAEIYGGDPSDPGLPITPEMITNGEIPTPSGGTVAPAVQIGP
ncbi:RHS repeat-associated core domain-containing protein [Streptomyces sp. NPDC090106]|uniref:RHS repeat-associated core domain-containing protein n=1 Tax=Streptomyces sp. NPDC090106 TaxID=3365946 RepID=UPI00381F9E03